MITFPHVISFDNMWNTWRHFIMSNSSFRCVGTHLVFPPVMHPVPCRSARKLTLLGCPPQRLQILFSHNPWLSKCREYHITFSVQLSYFLIIEISYFLLVMRQGCCHCRGFWRYILQATVETNKLEAEGHSLVKSEHIVRLNNMLSVLAFSGFY